MGHEIDIPLNRKQTPANIRPSSWGADAIETLGIGSCWPIQKLELAGGGFGGASKDSPVTRRQGNVRRCQDGENGANGVGKA